jgi:hypothetical protein
VVCWCPSSNLSEVWHQLRKGMLQGWVALVVSNSVTIPKSQDITDHMFDVWNKQQDSSLSV